MYRENLEVVDDIIPQERDTEEPPQPMRRDYGRPGRAQAPIPTRQDEVARRNIQVLRVGARLRTALEPALNEETLAERQRAEEQEAMDELPDGGPVRPPFEGPASESERGLATIPQHVEQVQAPNGARPPSRRRLRDTRRHFISDGMGGGRSYYGRTIVGTSVEGEGYGVRIQRQASTSVPSSPEQTSTNQQTERPSTPDTENAAVVEPVIGSPAVATPPIETPTVETPAISHQNSSHQDASHRDSS